MISELFFCLRFAFAVRTGLEPATPCVTGMYSNQLNYHTKMFVCIERPSLFSIASANVECFFEPANVLLQKNECLKFFDRIYREGVKCKWVRNNELSCEEEREVCLEKYLTGKICRFNFLINFDLGKRY